MLCKCDFLMVNFFVGLPCRDNPAGRELKWKKQNKNSNLDMHFRRLVKLVHRITKYTFVSHCACA
jgi:hypothetical protein